MAIVRPILELPQGQEMKGSDSQVGDCVVTEVSQELKDFFGFSSINRHAAIQSQLVIVECRKVFCFRK